MPTTQPIPLASMPYSGAPRDETFGEASDDDLGRFADFEWCLKTNGYRHECYVDTGPDSSGTYGSFQLETIPLVADSVHSCIVTPGGSGDSSIQSREQSMAILRSQYGSCHVGPAEDCDREQASGTHIGNGFGPNCILESQDCL